MYLVIATAGAAIWVLAVVFVVAACRVAAGSGPAPRARRGPYFLLERSAGSSRAVGSATARESGDLVTADMIPGA